MDWLKQSQTKSQLGQLLLKKHLISEEQLKRAIDLQKSTGQLLGDIFTQLGIVSQRQIEGMLRRQRNIRRIVTIVTALMAPIQVYAASAAPVTIEQTENISPSQKQHNVRILNEEELSQVVGQGALDDTLRDWLNLSGTANITAASNLANQNLTNASFSTIAKQTAGLQMVGNLVTLMDPLLSLLSAQVAVSNVVYNPAHIASTLNVDGSVTLSLPSSIGEIRFQNIRVMGSTGPALGSVDIKGINLVGTTVTLRAH